MGMPNVSLTKIAVPPRRKEILSRQRLLNLLYDLADKKLILISAPAGFGKTSFLIDLAHNMEIKVCWLSLDELDQDPQRFISYFIACIARCFPQFGNRSRSILESMVSLDQGAENLLISLVNEIYELIGEHFMVILDDYQFLDDIPFLRDFINRFIQLVGDNCHLLLSSRIVPALPDMLSMIARDQVGGISLLELAFQPDEVQLLFQKKYGTSLSPEALGELLNRTEGWITGIYLSRWSDVFSLPEMGNTAGSINLDVFEYLSKQVLDHQPEAVKRFLLETSLVDEFNEELCEFVFSDPDHPAHVYKKMIRTIQQNNLFIMPVGQGGKWFRYHHLFQDFLRHRMKQEYPTRVNVILDKSAQYYSLHGEWEKAYFFCEQLGDVQALITMVEEKSSLLVQNDHLITLGNWVDGIPELLALQRPIILSLKGFLSLVRGKPENGLSLLTSAESSFRSSNDLSNLALCLVRIAWAYRLLGDYPSAMKAARQVLDIDAAQYDLDSLHAEAQRSMGLCLFRLGKAQEAIPWYEAALGYYSKSQKKRHASMVETEVGMAYRALGSYSQAGAYYEHALLTLKEIGDFTWQATLLNSLGVLYHAQGEYEPAVKAFENGLDCARKSGYLDTEALILTSLADLYAEIGDMGLAGQTYQQAEGVARIVSDQFLLNYLSMVMADLSRQNKTFDHAFSLLDDVLPAVKASGSNYELGLYYLISGRLFLSTGNTQQAVWDLQTAIEHFEQGGLIMEHAWTRLWFAAACNEFGDAEAALSHFREALELVGDKQPMHSLAATWLQVRGRLKNLLENNRLDPAMFRLVGLADQLESEIPHIRKKLRQHSGSVAVHPPHMVIHTLGKADVRINGKLITGSEWQTKSVRDLFFYFFVISKPVTKEKIGTAFWPDISPAQLKLRFKNNIYRLRRALGQDSILFEDGLYFFNTDLDFECDIDQFRSELALARSTQDVSQQVEHYQNAINLVHGSYLEDIHADWAWHEREKVDQMYISALLSLSKLLLQNGNRDDAIKICQRAIDRDHCLEEAHQLAMQIYAAMRDRSAVTRQYRLCHQILKNELGSAPSHETDEIYRHLNSL